MTSQEIDSIVTINDLLISVIMPVYNRENFLDEAIESVLAQDYDSFELVLIDDGSTDSSPEILRKWSELDSRIVVITSPQNEGISGALNRGLIQARGQYIARIDSDDVMLPGRLSAQVKVLQSRPDIILVTSPFEYMDVDGKYIGSWQADESHEVVVFLLNFFNIIAGHGQVMYRKDDVLALGGYSMLYTSSEDFDLWGRLLQRGRIERVPVLGMRQRIHGNQSLQQYATFKRKNWHAIMGNSLRRYLERDVKWEEIEALITLWRLDGRTGMAAIADAISREAFKRFCKKNNKLLQRQASDRIAMQWKHAARHFTSISKEEDAIEYYKRSKAWFDMGNSRSCIAKIQLFMCKER